MPLRRIWLSLLLVMAAGALHGGEIPRHEYVRVLMGSQFRILVHAADEQAAQQAAEAAFAKVEEFYLVASDYLPESEISRLNKTPANTPFQVSESLFSVIAESLVVSELSDGAFDISAAHAVQHWRRARRQHRLPSAEQTTMAVARTDWRSLQLDAATRTVVKLRESLLIDVGGIGKGYAADIALLVLREKGFPQALVAASGDLSIGDPPPGKEGWDVALRTFEKPEEKDTLQHVLLSRCGCSTSGDLHQYFELEGKRYSHIINPATGLGLTERIACTVIAETATQADAWATALCIIGAQKGRVRLQNPKAPHLQARWVYDSSGKLEVETTEGFPVRLKSGE